MKEWTTPDFLNKPSTTNLEEEKIVDALGNNGNVSMPEQVIQPNPWRKMIHTYIYTCICIYILFLFFTVYIFYFYFIFTDFIFVFITHSHYILYSTEVI